MAQLIIISGKGKLYTITGFLKEDANEAGKMILIYICFYYHTFLFKQTHIKRFLSGLLLLVFILGITPKRFLHDAFAKHTDLKSNLADKPYQQVSKSGYNCDCDNLVAESQFEGSICTIEVHLPTFLSHFIFEKYSFSATPEIFSLLRGPPVNS